MENFNPLLKPRLNLWKNVEVYYLRPLILKLAIFGKQSTKYWLMCQKDLENMNESLSNSKGSVLLWCDARDLQKYEGKRQKKAEEEPPSKRQQIEDDLEEICQELRIKHGNKYSIPQLRCWAHLIMTGKHQSKDEIPEFLVNQLKNLNRCL